MKNRFISVILTIILIYYGVDYNAKAAYQKKEAIYSYNNSEMKIALTFDDGPHPVYTEKILDILKKYNIKATFFVVGENVKLYPDIVLRELKEGHEVGNHTYTHPRVQTLNYKVLKKEILMCENTVYELTDRVTKLLRPPEGAMDNDIIRISDEENYSLILWSIDTRDWAHESVNNIVENIRTNINAGDIILMHDYVIKSITPEVLETVIPMLLEKGYNFVTISELLGSE